MPGVFHSNIHFGFSREKEKMAFHVQPDLAILNDIDNGDLTDFFLVSPQMFLDNNGDSDCDLPDNEHPVDLINYLDSDLDFEHLSENKCDDGCNTCSNKYIRCVSTRQDPFLGMMWSTEHLDTSAGPSSSLSTLGQLPVDYDSGSDEVVKLQQTQNMKVFSAWNTPKSEDEPEFMATKSLNCWLESGDEDTSDLNFPETPSPSAPSGANTGDDSDVDIETVTDAPRSADLCEYITLDSSSEISPSASPEPSRKFHNIGLSLKSSTTQNTVRVTSSASSSDTLANHSSSFGQKRKHSKEKKSSSKSHSHTLYHHVLCNSNSVNFHDYAMSPGNYPTSTETGRPTVLSKRMYKRHASLDNSGKEKQHHHNQLERNRRQKLADLFVDLRDEVPKISGQAKASKVLILKESTLYIHDLQKLDKQQEDDISKERRRKELLKNKLRHLQAQISRNCVK